MGTNNVCTNLWHLRVRVECQQQLRAIQRLSAVCDLRLIVSTSMLLCFGMVKPVGNKLSISYIAGNISDEFHNRVTFGLVLCFENTLSIS